MHSTRTSIAVESVEVSAYTVPTDAPESDGTLEWSSTTLVAVEVEGGGRRGLGYTYADTSTARLIRDRLSGIVRGCDALSPQSAWSAMGSAVRNLGGSGIASMAIAAVDVALWDLKARLLDLPLVSLLGSVRESVPVYGSGGFTSYSERELQEQLAGWVARGIGRVKMKVGRDPSRDVARVGVAREAIGAETELFVDANGAYARKQALQMAERFAVLDVRWFEEPVPSSDIEGLRFLRDRAPAGMEIAAGEYAYELLDFRRLLELGAVDVLQADATRCRGITGFLAAAALCEAYGLRLSAHTAPALHRHPCCALPSVCHVEYFHDHARLERMLFDGASEPRQGELWPDLTRPGMGLELKRSDAERYATRF